MGIKSKREGSIEHFLSRQASYDDIKEGRLRRSKEKYEAKFTFKPELCEITKIYVKSDKVRAAERQEDKNLRLSKGDLTKREKNKEALRKKYYSKMTFRPEISRMSKLIGRESSIEELTQLREDPSLELQRFEQQEAELEECTFHPAVTDKGMDITSIYRVDEGLMDRINDQNTNKEFKLKRNREF